MKKADFQKYDSKLLKQGMKFTSPVFFDDGDNMFVAEGISVKAYHLRVINQWKIPFVLTYGKLMKDSPLAEGNAIPVAAEDLSEVGELEAV